MLNKFAPREVFDLYNNNNLQTATNHQLQVCNVESCALKGLAPEFPSAFESAELSRRKK